MFAICSLTVVGVVDVDTENTWTTLISKYGLPPYHNNNNNNNIYYLYCTFSIKIVKSVLQLDQFLQLKIEN